MRHLRSMSIAIALAGAVLAACAQGTSDNGNGGHVDAHALPDTNFNPHADAPVGFPDAAPGVPDAFVPPADAYVPPTPDAANALICTQTSDCSSDSCCVSIAGDGTPPGLCTFKFLQPVCMP